MVQQIFAPMTAANRRPGLAFFYLPSNSFDEGWVAAWLCNARELADIRLRLEPREPGDAAGSRWFF
jgi:hypothetical protein